ncbi:MAG: hypothetical protein ACFCVK_21250 [Acidimicrobiales bacterium]
MPAIDTPLLIVGHGPSALVAAKVLSARGIPSVVAGHVPVDDGTPVVLDATALAILEPNGVLGVLRPYAGTQDPFTIAPLAFEHALKHHCVADMLITVFDGMTLAGPVEGEGPSTGVLTDGRSRWEVRADAVLDTATLPTGLNAAIRAGAEAAAALAAPA